MQNKEVEKALKNMRIFARVHQDMATVSAQEMEIVLQYIDQLENQIKELSKGQYTLIKSKRKWKNRYYKEKKLAKKGIVELSKFMLAQIEATPTFTRKKKTEKEN